MIKNSTNHTQVLLRIVLLTKWCIYITSIKFSTRIIITFFPRIEGTKIQTSLTTILFSSFPGVIIFIEHIRPSYFIRRRAVKNVLGLFNPRGRGILIFALISCHSVTGCISLHRAENVCRFVPSVYVVLWTSRTFECVNKA